jgi:hypothetical protein
MNGFVAHERCLQSKEVPKFRDSVGELVVNLQGIDSSFEVFVNRAKSIRTLKEAERLALDLTKRLSGSPFDVEAQKTMEQTLERLKSLAKTHLFWDIPDLASLRYPRERQVA